MNKDVELKRLLEFSFINIDKPSGPTSFQVSAHVRERLGVRKTSHMGTLDPAVSGVLPIAINRACKLSPYLMKKDKRYVGIMRLHEDVDGEKLKKEMRKFVGKIIQLPPVRSSVKRAEREREIYDFKIIERDGKDVLFEADVEAGTYIRTLINDLGKNIGEAHMLELRRIKAGVFQEEKCVSLYDFEDAVTRWKAGEDSFLKKMIIPAEEIIAKSFEVVEIHYKNLDKILRGKPIHLNDLQKKITVEKGTYIGVFCNGLFVEITRAINAGDVIAVPEFVFN